VKFLFSLVGLLTILIGILLIIWPQSAERLVVRFRQEVYGQDLANRRVLGVRSTGVLGIMVGLLLLATAFAIQE